MNESRVNPKMNPLNQKHFLKIDNYTQQIKPCFEFCTDPPCWLDSWVAPGKQMFHHLSITNFRSIWMSAILSTLYSIHPQLQAWPLCKTVKSQDAKASVIWPKTKEPRHRRKTLGPIDGLTRQISGLAMGQPLKV